MDHVCLGYDLIWHYKLLGGTDSPYYYCIHRVPYWTLGLESDLLGMHSTYNRLIYL